MKCLLLFCTGTMKHYLIGLWHAIKIGFYITITDDKLNFQTDKKLQSTSPSQTSTIKMVMVPVWWSAIGLIHYSFLNPGKTITSEKHVQQIDEMPWKLQGCSKCWSTERTQISLRNFPLFCKATQRNQDGISTWFYTLLGFPGGLDGKESASNAGDPGWILGEDPLEEEDMATRSSVPAWRVPWTEQPGGCSPGAANSRTRLSD